jgi:hypothetical protein
MKIKSLKMAIKRILIVAIVGFVLTALAGCGISQGPYRHGYNGRNYRSNADYYNGGYGYSGNLSATPGYGSGRSGYCRW